MIRTIPCECDHHDAGPCAASGCGGRGRGTILCARPPTSRSATPSIPGWIRRRPVDRDLALRQWAGLVEAYQSFGHRVDLLDPDPGPAGHGLRRQRRHGARRAGADRTLRQRRSGPPRRPARRLASAQRHPLRRSGEVTVPAAVNEAEGDFAILSRTILAGYGFRTSRAAHAELAALTGRPVVSLELVDPRFYHLDVALTVLDDQRDHIAYYPAAFSPSQPPGAGRAVPDGDPRRRDRRVRLRAQLRQRRPQRVHPGRRSRSARGDRRRRLPALSRSS